MRQDTEKKAVVATSILTVLGVAAAIALGPGQAFADRTDVWLSSSVSVYKVELNKLADGGCSVQAHATVTKADGGVFPDFSKPVEVAGVNRADCLNILDVRAPLLFKSDKGL